MVNRWNWSIGEGQKGIIKLDKLKIRRRTKLHQKKRRSQKNRKCREKWDMEREIHRNKYAYIGGRQSTERKFIRKTQ